MVLRPVFCILAGVLSILFGVWAMQLYGRYTPLFQDIVCRLELPKLEDAHLGTPLISPTTFTFMIENRCKNPNAYTIGFAETEAGKVMLGPDRLEVGSALAAPNSNSSLPALSEGSVFTKAEAYISGEILLTGLSLLTEKDGVPLYVELNNQMKIDLHFWFGSWSVRKWVRKKCGLRMASLGSALTSSSDPAGPLACADSWDKLVVPSLTDTGTMDLVLSGDNMDHEELQKGRIAKNIGLGCQMAVGFGLGAVLIVKAVFDLCNFSTRSMAKERYEGLAQSSE